jgi:hypothetical protein
MIDSCLQVFGLRALFVRDGVPRAFLNSSSTGNKLDEQNDDSQHQQDVNIGADCMETYQSDQPED